MNQRIRISLLLLTFLPAYLHAQTELPNADLEAWVAGADFPTPEGWWSSHNTWGVPNNILDWTLERSFLNVQEGLYAAELETKIGDVFGLDIFRKYIPGVLTNGVCDLPVSDQLLDEHSIVHDLYISGGQPFEGMLGKLKGFYDYQPASGGDSAYIYLKLWKDDGMVVGEGTLFITDATSDYAPFEVPIVYSAMEEPDSLLIIIASSAVPRSATVGSRLFIDNLSFEFVEPNFVDSYAAQHGIAIRLFPNPATESLFLENPYTADVQLQVFNSLGQLVHQQMMLPGLQEVSVQKLAPGAHHYRMSTAELRIASGTFQVR
jgi:hypothetical protein